MNLVHGNDNNFNNILNGQSMRIPPPQPQPQPQPPPQQQQQQLFQQPPSLMTLNFNSTQKIPSNDQIIDLTTEEDKQINKNIYHYENKKFNQNQNYNNYSNNNESRRNYSKTPPPPPPPQQSLMSLNERGRGDRDRAREREKSPWNDYERNGSN
jgi:hypothetical protein